MERSFAEEVKQLGLEAGQVLRGEGILAITKGLLQSGVSSVGGYPGAPVSHLLDVLADANELLLKPMGVYLDASADEAAAAALRGPPSTIRCGGGDPEVHRRHQRGGRRPLEPGVGRRHRRGLSMPCCWARWRPPGSCP